MINNLPSTKVAIVHDWLYGGGAELVVEQLHAIFPEAPIYCTFATKKWRERLDGKVVTGYLGWWPFSRMYKFLGPLRILWYGNLKLTGYDLIISTSGAEAKGVRAPKGTVHINYCHAPTHYYWSRYDEYLQNPGLGLLNPLARLGLKLLVKPLRNWDYKAAKRPDYIIANSTYTQEAIKKYYGRESTIVFPPVYFERFQSLVLQPKKRHGFVIVGRHTPYKRLDLAITACTKLGLHLTVIGSGPDTSRLRELAGKNITFLGQVSDAVLAQEISQAEALLFPGVDDFGIAAIEAMAAGTPVVAYKAGGALDYIRPGVTGEFFTNQTAESLAETLRRFDGSSYSSAAIRAYAKRFSKEKFQSNMRSFITKSIGGLGKHTDATSD